MEFSETLEKRHSVRSFSQKEVEKEKLDKILSAAMSAPSAGNLQSYRITIVKDAGTREGISAASLGQASILQAPVLLVFSADRKRSYPRYGERGASLYSIQDATIAAAYSQLAAADLGLGSVWIGAFNPAEVSKILSLKGELPVAIIPIGHPTEPSRSPGPRRPKSEMVQEL